MKSAIRDSRSPLELARWLEPRLVQFDRRELGEEFSPLLAQLGQRLPDDIVNAVADAVLQLCRRLYAHARSGDAVPLALALLDQANLAANRVLERRATSACGLLLADTADVVGAIDYHVRSLRLAAADGDAVERSRIWNNIGLAFAVSGNHEMASRSYRRALELLKDESGVIFSRYTALGNLANSLYHLGSADKGLECGMRALQELTPAFIAQDPHSAILLRRNLVRLLIAVDRLSEAAEHVAEVAGLAAGASNPRAEIAAATTSAAYEIAIGRHDIALTRLDRALALSREVPGALRDTLACVVRAEEAAGNAERALARLHELSDHLYRIAVQRAHDHVEIDSLCAGYSPAGDPMLEQAAARLVACLQPPEEPEGWGALRRLGIAAALRMDNTGWHGIRVGALAKSLALAYGLPPLQALEIGLAAELHDVGLTSVPEGLVMKREALNPIEDALLRKHTEAGAEILRDDRHPRILMAREICRYHHARWDGTGYPARVGGEFIPLAARIGAVADAYDTLVCGHGRQIAMTMDEAMHELRREAGAGFDPVLVGCFELMMRGEAANLGIDLVAVVGLESFQELVLSLQEDRGFV